MQAETNRSGFSQFLRRCQGCHSPRLNLAASAHPSTIPVAAQCCQPWSYDPSFRVLVIRWRALGGYGLLEPRHCSGFTVKTKDMSPLAARILSINMPRVPALHGLWFKDETDEAPC